MNKLVFSLPIVIIFIFSIFSPIPTEAGNIINIVDSKVVIAGQEQLLISSQLLKLDQGNKASIHIKLSKTQNCDGIVRVLSDLNYVEGLLRLNLSDYQDKTMVNIQLTGIVPGALIQDGGLKKVGDKAFTLINVIVETNGTTDSLLSITSIATTPELQESALKIDQLRTYLRTSSNDERVNQAKKLLELASIAREAGNPSLSIAICDQAYEVMDINLTISSMSWWYWAIMLILILALITAGFLFINQRKTRQVNGWIKAR